MATDFARWIRRELQRRNLTQERAARDLDVSLSSVQRWVAGQSLPSFGDLVKIKKIWGVLPPPLG